MVGRFRSEQIIFFLSSTGISTANKIIIPAMAAVKFPDIEVNYSGNKTWKLPITFNRDMVDAEKAAIPKATLLCLSSPGNSQAMIDSWSGPFLGAYSDSKYLQLYEVSFIDSWFLRWNPIKQLLLRIMTQSNYEGKDTLQKQIFIHLVTISTSKKN
ncbi:hypothetical protein I3842_13G141400 [Carya illinoinensis]|uniref:Uncharacterized protein n=1 Tax=Carya illinoinensis TaxID=32201 RepID=A0A922AIT4_CARIL|nr:hypothetical protein I3842_Q140300 [Carya illinoinensis]KAG6617948.1 hypothetical protein I3842_Q140300 [Carya illinoinensis]KAG6682431.1 hypothetical protein I3842_13G141400 [Carya illinoinensis]KAG6682432.1 hypothetical protein I3842_13G141400 [Carya illinoinensis]KAG6682433.1 hypothetical protein I3842_13G141400 [Carya illinoinensis]